MSLLDNISNKVKTSFENETVKAPSKVWDDINISHDDKSIDNKIKSSFEEESLKAPVFNFPATFENKFNIDDKVSQSFEKERNVLPDSIWKAIQNDLDLNDVWISISNKVRINTFSWSKLAVASLLIAFISLLPPTQIKNPEVLNNTFFLGENNFIFENIANTILPRVKINQLANSTNKLIVKDRPIEEKIEEKNITNNYFEPNNFAIHNDLSLDEENLNIDKISLPISLIEQNISTIVTVPNEITATVDNKKRSNFRIGLFASINTTFINNEDTRNSFSKSSLLSSKMSTETPSGLSVDYYFNNNIGISASYLFHSSSKSKIGYYENGFYKIKTTEINYNKGSVLFNYAKSVRTGKSNEKYIFSAGPYLAFNKNSMIIAGETITSFNTSYKKFDYGLKLQIGKEQQWSNLILGYGLNTDIGVRNILNNTSLEPNKNYSSNFNIGLYTTLKYEF